MKKSSVVLSTVFTVLFLVALLGLVIFLPRLLKVFGPFFYLLSQNVDAILWAFYFCVPFVAAALVCLLVLLRYVRTDQPFSQKTGDLMSVISWCCIAVAGITLISSFWYFPLALVTVAMLFIFLIVRVVRMCFLAATELKEENRLTI